MRRASLLLCAVLLACPGASTPDAGPSAPDAGEPDAGAELRCACPSSLACDEASGQCRAEALAWVKMADGVALWTRIYLPADARGPVPVIVERSPYLFPLKGSRDFQDERGRFHASRGYAFVSQSVRGRFESEGTFRPYVDEYADGARTLDWVAAQPWCNGKIGTLGSSYMGFTALAAAVDQPKVAVIIADDAPEDEAFEFAGGTPSLGELNWQHLLDHAYYPASSMDVQSTNALDALGADTLVLGREAPFWRQVVQAEAPVGPVYDEHTLRTRYARICAPALILASAQSRWSDPIRIWRGLSTQGCPQHRSEVGFLFTQEKHSFHTTELTTTRTPENQRMLDALDHFLRGGPAPALPFAFAASGDDAGYRTVKDWPPPANEQVLYLSNSTTSPTLGDLTVAPPGAQPADALEVDPETMDPCSNSYPYAAYLGPVQPAGALVAGEPRLELHVSASSLDADVFAFLYEYRATATPKVKAFGRSGSLRLRFRDGASAPLTPDVPVKVTLSLPPIAHRLAPGSALMLVLTAGDCRFLENPQSGEPLAAQTRRQKATLRYLHDSAHASRLLVPVLAP